MNYQDSRTRAKNRQKIVDAARALFIAEGIAHTTVMDIVKKVGMERKTFYNYFHDKESIADYIYYLEMCKFYAEGFGLEAYQGLTTGYQKIEKYLTTLVDHTVQYSHEILFVVHHQYYFKKQVADDIINKIYEDNGVVDTSSFFTDGVNDGSIDVGEKNPADIYNVIEQSIGSFSTRLIYRGYRQGVNNVTLDFRPLYDLLELHLQSIKAS